MPILHDFVAHFEPMLFILNNIQMALGQYRMSSILTFKLLLGFSEMKVFCYCGYINLSYAAGLNLLHRCVPPFLCGNAGEQIVIKMLFLKD